MSRRYVQQIQYFLITFNLTARGRIIRLVAAENYELACESIKKVENGAKNFKNLTIGNVEGLKLKY